MRVGREVIAVVTSTIAVHEMIGIFARVAALRPGFFQAVRLRRIEEPEEHEER